MLKASLELNRALEKIVQMSDELGDAKDFDECEVNGEEILKTTTKFLKCYELCVRIDESLGDIVRHQGTDEIESSLERTKELTSEIADVVRSFNKKEKRVFLANTSPDFKESKRHFDAFLKKRPGARIWHEEDIQEVIAELSHTIMSFRKSAGYAVLMTSVPKGSLGSAGTIRC